MAALMVMPSTLVRVGLVFIVATTATPVTPPVSRTIVMLNLLVIWSDPDPSEVNELSAVGLTGWRDSIQTMMCLIQATATMAICYVSRTF